MTLSLHTAVFFAIIFLSAPTNADQLAKISCRQPENGHDDDSQCSEYDHDRDVAAEVARRSLVDEPRRRQAAFAARSSTQTHVGGIRNGWVAEHVLTGSDTPPDTPLSEMSDSDSLEDAARAWLVELGSESALATDAAAASGTPAFTEIGVTVVIPAGLTEGQVRWLKISTYLFAQPPR